MRALTWSKHSSALCVFDAVIEAAKEVKERLEQIGLVSFCKTTGGKGLHVVTPLHVKGTKLGWEQAKALRKPYVLRWLMTALKSTSPK